MEIGRLKINNQLPNKILSSKKLTLIIGENQIEKRTFLITKNKLANPTLENIAKYLENSQETIYISYQELKKCNEKYSIKEILQILKDYNKTIILTYFIDKVKIKYTENHRILPSEYDSIDNIWILSDKNIKRSDLTAKIQKTGFENLDLDEKVIKAEQIWQDRKEKNTFQKGQIERKWGGEFQNQNNFVKWYLAQPRICRCCHVEENKIRSYFYDQKEHLEMTRNKTRCHILELDKENNHKENKNDKLYTEQNCALLCYVCNNAKSNLCNDYKSFEPIAKGIKKFFDSQPENQKK